MRDFVLRALVLFGAAVAVLTEVLSPFHLLRRGPLACAWVLVALAAGAFLWRRRPAFARPAFHALEAAIAAVILVIAGLVGLTAFLSPPNSADAMAYHMPRVVYWAQAGSVAFFPTPYFNQITLQPLDEYFLLHTYILAGGDRWINLVAFGAFLGSILGVSALAGTLGLGRKGQAFAALFCATLPNGILQASGAKNDWMLALWLVLLVYFAARRSAPLAGLALGLALATKATAYLFAPPLLVFAVWMVGRPPGLMVRARVRAAAFLLAGVALINGPQYARNMDLSGSPLGYDSAHGDGFFRWRNEHPGWKSTVSNALRHTSDQLGARDARWNAGIFEAVAAIHGALVLDPQDPDTTFRWSRYEPPVNSNHEANANNRWHLLLLGLALFAAALTRRRRWVLYPATLFAAFLFFCLYLKWQPFLSRLELPLFVLAAPLAGFFLEWLRPPFLALLVCLFLVSNARPALLLNWTRPLKGPHNLFTMSRQDLYFSDMGQWNNRASYLEAVDRTAQSGCATVGLDSSENQLEYPFQALLRERRPAARFLHTGVENASARYFPASAPRPCAVLCLDCIGNQKKLALYRSLGPPISVGRFLLFLAAPLKNDSK